MTLTVRRATRADIESVARLAGELVRLHHQTDTKRFFLPERVEEGYAWWLGRELDRKEAVVLVAEADERIVGYAYGSLEERNWNALLDAHGEIHDLYVVETQRRTRVGRALLEALVRELEHLGADPIVLATMVDNVAAQRLFEAAGFRRTMVEFTRDAGGPR